MNRPTRKDRDFFESRPLKGFETHRSHRVRLRDEVEAMISRGGDGFKNRELDGVLKFLNIDDEHDSEGRDLGFDKRSFSRNELNVAARHRGRDRVRYLIYRYRFDRYPREKVLTEFPTVLAVEPTSICNLRCIMCFQADPAFTDDRRAMGRMDFDLYRAVIDEGETYGLCSIILASRGEPVLHPRIGDMIAYAKVHGVLDVKLNTNATALTEEKSREMLTAGLDTLVFSIDSHEAEEFERIRPPARFDRVVRNIERFHEIRAREFPDSTTRTRVSMVQLHDGQSVEDAAAFWRGRVDEFGHRWVIDRLKIYNMDMVPRARPCSLLWERLYVWFDGTINPCDEDYRSVLSPGTIKSFGSVHAAWHSETMMRYRRLHVDGKKNDLHPCDKCNGF